VIDDWNFVLNESLINFLLQQNSEDNIPDWRSCLMAKAIAVIYIREYYKFCLFGDPAVRLLMPKNDATIDSIMMAWLE